MLQIIEKVIGPSPRTSMIWLHGLGASGDDFVPIAEQLALSTQHGIRFLFPHAPFRPVALNGGLKMRAWYDLYSLDFDSREDKQGIIQSAQLVSQLINQEQALGIHPLSIFLAGFSQGGALALFCGLLRPSQIGGIIALSTYLPLRQQFLPHQPLLQTATPVFMAHGAYDEVVALSYATQSRDILRECKIDVDWHEYPYGHHVGAEEINALRSWLTPKLEHPT